VQAVHGAGVRSAPQRPATQAQRPWPQSSVPGAQFCVHIIAVQLGARAAGTQAFGWQQVAGTQSPSLAHSTPGEAAPPPGLSSRTCPPPALTAGGRSLDRPVAVPAWSAGPDWIDSGDGGYAPGDRGPGSA